MRTATKKTTGWEDRYYQHDLHPMIPPELGRLPSVTTITGCYPKPWMMGWVKKESRLAAEALTKLYKSGKLSPDEAIEGFANIVNAAESKRESAATIGKVAHEHIHHSLVGKDVPAPEDPKVREILATFEGWKRRVEFRLVDTERVVWSARHGYAGRLDTVGWVEGHLTLVDFKTSSGIYKDMAIQIAAYANAWDECTPKLYGADGKAIERLKIIRVGKDEPEWDEQDFTDKWRPAFETFLALKNVWEYDRNGAA